MLKQRDLKSDTYLGKEAILKIFCVGGKLSLSPEREKTDDIDAYIMTIVRDLSLAPELINQVLEKTHPD